MHRIASSSLLFIAGLSATLVTARLSAPVQQINGVPLLPTSAVVDAAPMTNDQPPFVGVPITIGAASGQDPTHSIILGQREAEELEPCSAALDLSMDVVAVINPDDTIDSSNAVDQVGDIIRYDITVSNTGCSDLTGVVIDDPLLGGNLFFSTDAVVFSPGATITCSGDYTVTLVDIATRRGGDDKIENVASVTAKDDTTTVTVTVTATDSVATPISLATISGNVKLDTDADGIGNVGIAGVRIDLFDEIGVLLNETVTDASGNFAFVNIPAGNYRVREESMPGYIDVKDTDGGDPNEIFVGNVIGGTDRVGNDFVDEREGSISGYVFENTLYGPPLASVLITLHGSSDAVIATTSTDSNGFYKFSGVIPGLYTVVETNLSTEYEDVADYDSVGDGDPQDGDVVVDGKVFVEVNSAEDDARNDFVDKLKNGSISGVVTDDRGNTLAGVTIILKLGGDVVAAATTEPDGTYSFTNLVPGDYVVEEINPAGFPIDISDYDNSDDLDPSDKNTAIDNSIGVQLHPGEDDKNNNFVDSNSGKISGTVKDDEGTPLVSVLIALTLLSDNTTVATTLTGSDGSYLFSQLAPGDYNVFEQNPAAFPINISDRDTNKDTGSSDPADSDISVDNKIGVRLLPGEFDEGNDFVDSNKGKITGSVTDNLSNPLIGVLLELKSGSTVIKSTLTGANGAYAFEEIPPGTYTVVETNPSSFPTNISDKDNSPDGDPTDGKNDIDNVIGVKLDAGETDSDNDFVDAKTGSVVKTGSISGTVKDDNGKFLRGVIIQLKDSTGAVLRTTATGRNGAYVFSGVVPGTYSLFEINPPGYTTDVSDRDTKKDGDAQDSNKAVDNTIGVVLTPGENDKGNDFVDSIKRCKRQSKRRGGC